MENNMTKGSPGKLIVRFTMPVFIGNVFQQFYNMVDAVVVGKFVGTKALAGVGATGTINFLIIGFLIGLTAGFTVLTAQKFGAGDMNAMRKTVASAAILSLIVSVVMTAASVIFMKDLLRLLNTPEDIFDYAYEYIVIICAGIFAQVLYNLLSSILRALGNSRTPLYFLILAALLNVVLDLVFIICFGMGPAGAAYATVISQGVSGAACLIYIWKAVPHLHLHKEDWKVEGDLLRTQMRIGFPMALQYSITAIGTMMVQSALNLLGSISVAAFTAASKIEQIVTQAYVALGTAMATYCAQNMGAGDIKKNPAGIPLGNHHRFRLFGCGCGTDGPGRTLSYVSLCRSCGCTAGNRRSPDVSDLCVCILHPADCGEPVPQRNSGNGIRIPPDDCGNCRIDRKRCGGNDCLTSQKLRGRLPCQSDGMDSCGKPASGHVL